MMVGVRVFDLEQPRTESMPIHPAHRQAGYSYHLHRRHEERYFAGAGMAASASYWLADRQVLAVGADNMAWDVPGLRDPELGYMMPGHLILLARSGIYIIAKRWCPARSWNDHRML